jgi:hypothetical protein
MVSKNIIYCLILILFPIFLYAEDKPKDPVKWSPFQGKRTWQEAKEQCLSLKMRLPTISELRLADEAGTTKGWRKNGTRFWAVNKNLKSETSTYSVISLLGSDRDKKEENHKVESSVGVFCANVTEESAEIDVIRELVENNASESEIQKARDDLGAKLSAKQFSEYQGMLTWDDANKKCKSLKMRLPTLDELKKAYESGITKSWQKDGYRYWSSTPFDAERYYRLNVDDGNTYHDDRSNNNYVRCRR